MRLADFILEQLEAILLEWEQFAITMEPAALTMTTKELRNHAAVMLKAISEDLRVAQTINQQSAKARGLGPRTIETIAGENHGVGRLESQFTIEQLVSEYRALRASVLHLWSTSNKSPLATDIEDITRFNESIDHLLAASVFSFSKATRQALEAEKKHRDDFLAMLAHELRNPLAPISAAAALLKKANGDRAMMHSTGNIIARQVEHMATLVDDLLDVSRVTRGLINLKHEPLDMRRVVADAVEQVTPQIQARHHHLAVRMAPETAIVLGDNKRLVQVLANLLSNAAKYTPEHGHIALSMALHDDHVMLIVEDDGIGLAPEFISHAFDLFAQAERSSDRSSGGLGLGLALVKGLVGLHDGTVSCSSPGIGKGSRFTVCLPRQPSGEQEVERRRASRVRLTTGKPLKVMVVDDNVDAATMLGMLLEAAGHQVIIEHGSRRALAVAQDALPDACILDIGLPGMDGYEMARQLRASPGLAKTLLIALTGYGQVHDHEEAIAAGFDYHMTKPVTIEKLLDALIAFQPSR